MHEYVTELVFTASTHYRNLPVNKNLIKMGAILAYRTKLQRTVLLICSRFKA